MRLLLVLTAPIHRRKPGWPRQFDSCQHSRSHITALGN